MAKFLSTSYCTQKLRQNRNSGTERIIHPNELTNEEKVIAARCGSRGLAGYLTSTPSQLSDAADSWIGDEDRLRVI